MKKTFIISASLIFLAFGCAIVSKSNQSAETVSINLAELPDTYSSKLSTHFDIRKINTDNFVISKKSLEKEISHFIKTGIINENINELNLYNEQSHPRMCYWEYIINQLPSFVNYGYRYDSYSDRMDEKGQLFAYLVYRINRNPDHIKKLFNYSKSTIYRVIDQEKFQSQHLDRYVKTLINVYTHLKKMEDYEDQMKRIYTAVIKEDKNPDIHITGRVSNQYPIYEPILSKNVINKFKGTNGMVLNDWGEYTDVLWFHSFWVRRYNEGNSEIIFEILKDIEKHYN